MCDDTEGFYGLRHGPQVGGLRSGNPILRVVRRPVELVVDERAPRPVCRDTRRPARERVDIHGLRRSHPGHQVQELVNRRAPLCSDHDRERLDLLAHETVFQRHLVETGVRAARNGRKAIGGIATGMPGSTSNGLLRHAE